MLLYEHYLFDIERKFLNNSELQYTSRKENESFDQKIMRLKIENFNYWHKLFAYVQIETLIQLNWLALILRIFPVL